MESTFRQVLARPDKDGCCRIVPAHFRLAAQRVVSPKDLDAAVANAKLAALVKPTRERRPVGI